MCDLCIGDPKLYRTNNPSLLDGEVEHVLLIDEED